MNTDATPASIGADALRVAAQAALTALENLHEIDTETECITIDVRDEIDALRAALVSAAQPALTVTALYDLSPAAIEGAIRDKLIEIGWTPPDAAAPTGAQDAAPEDHQVRKLAAIGAVHAPGGLVERRPNEYRRELEDQFVRGFRAAERRLYAMVQEQQAELTEQARLLGISVEREMALRARVQELERAVAAEREECAQVCDALYHGHIGAAFGEVRYGIAACAGGIRARGAQGESNEPV